ncbi:MAG: DUF4870 domain-containing protein [Candidatus Krumholzibacteria bacterium]|nr:DUF4870 domain-containing protein [Candidatus Krumholzibacteria bacterium]
MAGEERSEALSREARKWAMICHIIALVGILGNGIGFLVGPLVVWLLKREDDPFINEQGKEAVNFQITMFIALIVSALLAMIVIGIFLLIAVGILMTVFPIIAAIKANDGNHYAYPLSYRFIK